MPVEGFPVEDTRLGGLPSAPSALAIERLSMTFPGTRALDDVSFAVAKGSIHALLGQNGCGKSTLIRILSGFHHPDDGSEVRVADAPMKLGDAAASHQAGLRFVHQGLGLIEDLDVLDSFGMVSGFVRRATGAIDWRTHRQRVEADLARFGVEVDVRSPIARLDPVEKTAVAIARALDGIDGDGILVLDEPTVALTRGEVERLFTILRDVRRAGVSLVYVSHYLDEVFDLADRMTVLRGGKHVMTEDVHSVTQAQVVTEMVGRSVDGHRRPVSTSPNTPHREPVLSITGTGRGTLAELQITIGRGEVVGVAGLQGSGIGELPYVLVGADRSSAGSLTVNGDHVARSDPARQMARGLMLVPRDRRLKGSVARFSVRENMTLARQRSFARRGWIRRGLEQDFVRSWIDSLGITPTNGERDFENLSGGNQQKVVLAKWLSMSPAVLILDEPTNGVDVGARQTIYRRVREEAAAGISFLVVSSDAAELAQLCDRVLCMERGSVACELSGDDQTEAGITQHLQGAAAR